MLGIPQWKTRHQRMSFVEAFMRPFRTLAKPVVVLVNFFYMGTFMWVVGISAYYPHDVIVVNVPLMFVVVCCASL